MKNQILEKEKEEESIMIHLRISKVLHTKIIKINAKDVSESGIKKTLSETGAELIENGLRK